MREVKVPQWICVYTLGEGEIIQVLHYPSLSAWSRAKARCEASGELELWDYLSRSLPVLTVADAHSYAFACVEATYVIK